MLWWSLSRTNSRVVCLPHLPVLSILIKPLKKMIVTRVTKSAGKRVKTGPTLSPETREALWMERPRCSVWWTGWRKNLDQSTTCALSEVQRLAMLSGGICFSPRMKKILRTLRNLRKMRKKLLDRISHITRSLLSSWINLISNFQIFNLNLSLKKICSKII